MEFGYWNENFQLWPLFVDNGITNNAEADLFFNFDRIQGISGNIWLSPNFGNEVIEEREKDQSHDERRRPAGRSAEGRARHHPALHQGHHRHPG